MKEDERLIKERERLRAMHETEAELSCGKHFVFGIDEAGRGPLCGPVVAACVILPEDAEIMYLNDSKKLSEKRREELFDIIKSTAVSYGIGICSEKTIDEINILNATLEAMYTAFEECLKQYRISCLERFSDKGADFKEAFVLMAMNALIKRFKSEQQYSVKLHEVVTLKIIEEVSLRICDIGFIYYYDTTEEFIKRELKRTNLIYHPLCDARPCVYLSKNHPLADEKSLSLPQLAGYPYICYDLGTDSNSFAEEIYAPHNTHKVISVTDRSSMLKLIAHTNAYTTYK